MKDANEADVKRLSALARIRVTPEEAERFEGEIGSILAYVQTIASAKASPDEHFKTTATDNVLREDGEPHPSAAFTDAILAQAPATEKGYLKVKKIL